MNYRSPRQWTERHIRELIDSEFRRLWNKVKPEPPEPGEANYYKMIHDMLEKWGQNFLNNYIATLYSINTLHGDGNLVLDSYRFSGYDPSNPGDFVFAITGHFSLYTGLQTIPLNHNLSTYVLSDIFSFPVNERMACSTILQNVSELGIESLIQDDGTPLSSWESSGITFANGGIYPTENELTYAANAYAKEPLPAKTTLRATFDYSWEITEPAT